MILIVDFERTGFTYFSWVSIVDFEQLNASQVVPIQLLSKCFQKNFFGNAMQGNCFFTDRILRKFKNYRGSRPELFCKKGVLRNFTKFTKKHLCQRVWHRWFPVNFVKFLRTTFFIEHLWWLLQLSFRISKRFHKFYKKTYVMEANASVFLYIL